MQKRLKELAAALKAEPGSIPRRLELAAALRDAGRSVDAIDLYRGVAAAYAEEGRLVQAMAVCKGILEIDTEHRDTLEMLATLAQKSRAGRKVVATELRQVDGRWIAEPARPQEVLDQYTPAASTSRPELTPPGGFSLVPGSTRVGDEPEATRVGEEEPSDVRGALLAQTPPRGTPVPSAGQVSGFYDKIDIASASPRDTQPGSTMEDLAASELPSTTVGEVDPEETGPVPVAMRRDLDTVRMSSLSDAELSARDVLGGEPVPDRVGPRDTPVHGFQTVQEGRGAKDRATVAGKMSARPSNDELYAPDEATQTAINDAMAAPFPRPTLKVEPPPFPLLSDLPRPAFLELLTRMAVVRLEAGQNVLREGEMGDACYLIAGGAVRVTKKGVEVAVLGPGSFFGEFAVLADQRRHASVETIEPVELLEIRRGLLDELVAAHPGVARTLRRFYRERLLGTLMATAPFFEKLQAQERAAVVERFRPRRFGRGARIIEEGSPGGGLYLILVGEVEVVRGQGDAEKVLGKLGEGSYFGEMSLLRGGTASATVRASRMTEVVQLPPRDFYEVVSQHPVLWEQLRSEAEKREMANHAIVAGEARKSDDGTIYLV